MNKIYHEQNKEALQKRAREKHTCGICGCIYSMSNKARHETTKKHLQALEATTVDT